MYKLVAMDIDGTLLDSYGNISKENIEAIKKAKEQNIEVVLTSGRMPKAMLAIASEANANNYFMLFSACWINFLTMLPPILPASFADISPLYPFFRLTPTSLATSYLNFSNEAFASGTKVLLEFDAISFHLLGLKLII